MRRRLFKQWGRSVCRKRRCGRSDIAGMGILCRELSEEKNLVAGDQYFFTRNGTRQKTAFQLNEHFEYYGAYLNRACYNETATVTLHCLNKHIQELLPVVRELITDSVMPQEELDTYRQNMKQRLKVNLKKSDFVASRLIDAYVYGEDHPYGKYTRLDDFDLLNREELMSFYKQYYQQGKFVMFVAGRLPSGWQEMLNRYFGDLPNTAVAMNPMSMQPVAEKKSRVINDAEGVQGSIGWPALFSIATTLIL